MSAIDRTGANRLQITDGDKHEVNDIRIYTGDVSPDVNAELSDCVNGDIYFKKGYGVKSDDYWNYIIKNGICECWRVVIPTSKGFANQWGSRIYYVDGALASRPYPVTFKSLPRDNVTLICRGSNTV